MGVECIGLIRMVIVTPSPRCLSVAVRLRAVSRERRVLWDSIRLHSPIQQTRRRDAGSQLRHNRSQSHQAVCDHMLLPDPMRSDPAYRGRALAK